MLVSRSLVILPLGHCGRHVLSQPVQRVHSLPHVALVVAYLRSTEVQHERHHTALLAVVTVLCRVRLVQLVGREERTDTSESYVGVGVSSELEEGGDEV